MTATATRDRALETSLLLLRLSLGVFFLVWSIDKITNPGHTQAVFENFYMMPISPEIALAAGIVQTVVVAAFMAGAFKTLSYGALMLMHTVSTLSTWQQLVTPYQGGAAILFWAAVPVLFALIGLFVLRERDRLLSIS